MKVVINTCFGGFGLSAAAAVELSRRKGYEVDTHGSMDDDEDSDQLGTILRTDKDLVAVVEEMGKAVNSWASELKVVEIPDDVDWYISEYDGVETVEERAPIMGIELHHFNKPEIYGDISLSVQYGEYPYSTPRENLQHIGCYTAVEIGILDANDNFIMPSQAHPELAKWDEYFEEGGPGGYVPVESVNEIRRALLHRMLGMMNK